MICGFVIPDWPATTKWLSEEEKALGVVRLVEDAGAEEEDIGTFTAFKMAASDYRVWLCILGQLGVQAIASLTNFLPTLVKSFGFSTIHTLLLTAPVSCPIARYFRVLTDFQPYVVTGCFCVLNLWYSDRISKRSPFMLGPIAIAAIGIIITLATTNVPAVSHFQKIIAFDN